MKETMKKILKFTKNVLGVFVILFGAMGTTTGGTSSIVIGVIVILIGIGILLAGSFRKRPITESLDRHSELSTNEDFCFSNNKASDCNNACSGTTSDMKDSSAEIPELHIKYGTTTIDITNEEITLKMLFYKQKIKIKDIVEIVLKESCIAESGFIQFKTLATPQLKSVNDANPMNNSVAFRYKPLEEQLYKWIDEIKSMEIVKITDLREYGKVYTSCLEAMSKEVANLPENKGKVVCPRCASLSISANKKGFGAGKAAVGVLAVGAIGLAAGGLGSGKVEITCLNCGHKWKPGKN